MRSLEQRSYSLHEAVMLAEQAVNHRNANQRTTLHYPSKPDTRQ